MASNDNAPLNVTKFREIIDEYQVAFTNPPKTANQVAQFCKDKQYCYKYGELNPFFVVWTHQQQQQEQQRTETAGNDCERAPQEHEAQEIDWDAFWNEYQEQYGNAPKNPVHLWNFAKEEKSVSVKYKEARTAFDRITKDRASATTSPLPIEGRRRSVTSLSDLSLKNASRSTTSPVFDTQSTPAEDSGKVEIRLKIGKYTADEELDGIKTLFLECLNAFRASILHDPRNAVQLFNFINEDTTYRVRYGDVKSCYTYAARHDWFTPMKRMKKVVTDGAAEEVVAEVVMGDANDCDHEEEGVQFVLQVDHDKIEQKRQQQNKKEEEKKESVALDLMLDEQFDALLVQYLARYENAPRNASQIMNFATELGQNFKYKACRIAFQRWQQQRGGAIPKVTTLTTTTATTAGALADEEEVDCNPGAQAEDDNENENENENEEEEAVDADSDADDDLNSNEDDE